MSEIIPDPYDRAQADKGMMGPEDEFKSGSDPGDCALCAPFPCDDPDNHLGPPPGYGPPEGCHCGAWSDGRDCMCFEDV